MASCMQPERRAAAASVAGDGSLGARQSREGPAVPGCYVVIVNLLGSLHTGPLAQMTHSETLQDFSFFLRRVEEKTSFHTQFS